MELCRALAAEARRLYPSRITLHWSSRLTAVNFKSSGTQATFEQSGAAQVSSAVASVFSTVDQYHAVR